MTKSDDGERTCPLCTEEMDLTDQQLKPCKCGYEICVWCWHHIVEMAEKDGTGGKCPACRAPYDKERIVGMSASCERLVTEINTDKRTKAHKGKPKTSAEARKHLANVRVIQRNLVYIIGLPPTVADVHILERKEYFGKYGKIIKISISRSCNGMQQSANSNGVSLYVTYSREEEAIRCIEAVHNFVLEGKPLRACFGTTKYCHSWIRNMTCNNPDCYYLHDIGSQEDSFTKNEIISAYSRSRLPQIALNTSRCRAGNILPPPADAFCTSGNVSSSKIASKSSLNHSATLHKGSPPNGSGLNVPSTVLPTVTAWGLCPSGSTHASLPCLQGSKNKKQEVSRTKQSSSREDGMIKLGRIHNESYEWLEDGKLRTSESCKVISGNDSRAKVSCTLSDVSSSSAWHDDAAATALRFSEDSCTTTLTVSSKSLEASNGDLDGESHATVLDPSLDDATTQHITSAWDDEDDTIAHNSPVNSELHSSARCTILSTSGHDQEQEIRLSDGALETALNEHCTLENSASTPPLLSSLGCTENSGVSGNRTSTSDCAVCEKSHMTSTTFFGRGHNCSIASTNLELEDVSSGLSLGKVEVSSGGSGMDNSDSFHGLVGLHSDSMYRVQPSGCQPDHSNSAPSSMLSSMPEDTFITGAMSNLASELEKQAIPPLDNKIKDIPEAFTKNTINHSDIFSHAAVTQTSSSPCLIPDDCGVNCSTYLHDSNYRSNCLSGSLTRTNIRSNEASDIPKDGENFLSNGSFVGKVASLFNNGNSGDKSSHTEGAKSMDNEENAIISNILSMDFDPWSDPLSANNSFIKQLRETGVQNTYLSTSSSPKPQSSHQSRFSFARQEHHISSGMIPSKSSSFQDPFGDWLHSGATASKFPQCAATFSGQSAISSDRTPGVSRVKILAPPGFSPQTRPPPPGFSSQNNANQVYSRGSSDDHILGGLSLGNRAQLPHNCNTSDVEFIDPAILAVVRGGSPVAVPTEFGLGSFPSSQNSAPESNSRFQLLSNPSIPVHRNQRISDHTVDNLLHLNGRLPTWFAEQNFSNSSLHTERFLHSSEDSHASNNQWDLWSNIQSENDLALAEILRNGHGPNNIHPGSENFNFHVVNPSNVYSQAFGF